MRKHVKARIARNRDLAARDAANRCGYCRKPLSDQRWEAFLTRGVFCSEDCSNAADELLTMLGAKSDQ